MSRPDNLPALRAELKRQLASGTYDLLAERLIRGLRKLFPRLPKGDLAPFLLFSIGHFLLVCLLYRWDGVPVLQEWMPIAIFGALLFWSGLILYARLFRQLYRVLSEQVIDTLTQAKDLQDLSRWLGWFSRLPLTWLTVGLIMLLTEPYLLSNLSATHGPLGIGALAAQVSGLLATSTVMYHLLVLMSFPLVLSRYQIDLYELDPGASPVIRQLSTVIRNSAYQLSLYATLFTFYMFYMQVRVFPLALLYLLPLLGIFLFRQIALSRIVSRARSVVLDRLRQKIEALEIERHFDDPVIYNQARAMMDYYDRVKNANSGVFDLRTGLLLINSLLLPATAFMLTNYDRLVKFFGRIP